MRRAETDSVRVRAGRLGVAVARMPRLLVVGLALLLVAGVGSYAARSADIVAEPEEPDTRAVFAIAAEPPMSLALRAAERRASPTPSPTSKPRTAKPSPTPRPFVWPADGWFVQAMAAGHPAGIDIGLEMGAEVRAVRDGTVVFAGGDPCCVYGNFVIVQHDEGWSSLYAHLSAIDVRFGERVSQGERIGLAGSTGKSSGPHVHFELRSGNGAVDPLDYLPARQGFATGLAAYAQQPQPYAAPESYAAAVRQYVTLVPSTSARGTPCLRSKTMIFEYRPSYSGRGLSGKYVNALTPMMESFHDGSTANALVLSSLSSSRNT